MREFWTFYHVMPEETAHPGGARRRVGIATERGAGCEHRGLQRRGAHFSAGDTVQAETAVDGKRIGSHDGPLKTETSGTEIPVDPWVVDWIVGLLEGRTTGKFVRFSASRSGVCRRRLCVPGLRGGGGGRGTCGGVGAVGAGWQDAPADGVPLVAAPVRIAVGRRSLQPGGCDEADAPQEQHHHLGRLHAPGRRAAGGGVDVGKGAGAGVEGILPRPHRLACGGNS